MKPRHVLVLTYWSLNEALIQTYTLPYVDIILKNLPGGSKVFLLTLEKNKMPFENIQRERLALQKQNIEWIPFNYYRFGVKALFLWLWIFARLTVLIVEQNIRTIHAWCTPAGAAGYILSIITGRPLIIDSYEPHAESMVENNTWSKNSLSYKLLFWLEKKQTARATHIISATEGMYQYALQKYQVAHQSFHVKPACVDLDLFSLAKIKNQRIINNLGFANKIVCVYAGKFGGIYLEHEVFDFFLAAKKKWGDAFRVLLLTNHARTEIEQYCVRAGLDPSVVISRFVPHHEIADYLGIADFAITPVKPVPSKRYCTPIKDGEYWAMGLPVVIPDQISDDSEIIEKNKVGVVLRSFTPKEYERALAEIENMLANNMRKEIRSVAEKYRSFNIAENVYKKVYAPAPSKKITRNEAK